MQDVIRDALKNRSFEVYYQPIWNVQRGVIESAEALLRLKEPEQKNRNVKDRSENIKKDRSVEELITAAEESGLIVEIGHFVLSEVCRFIAEELPENLGIRYIEVNLSAVQCEKEELTQMVKNTLEQFGVRPEQIRFEITETAPVCDLAVMQKNLQMLSEYGSEFLVDDYGTGYAGLSYLTRFPAKAVKLDKSLLWEAEKSKKAEIILESTVEMLRRMDLQIVAEGVETSGQKERLMELRCEYLQGYLFSKPLCGKEFITYCKTHNLEKVST